MEFTPKCKGCIGLAIPANLVDMPVTQPPENVVRRFGIAHAEEFPVRLRLLALTAAALLGASCVTPSVPIPPPEPELMVFEANDEDGLASFSYDPQSGYGFAIVYVFNRDRGEGIITTARDDGSVGPTEPFPALIGEDLIITFETDEQIASRCITLADGRSGPQFECNL